MNLDLHPDLRLCQLEIGTERAPLLVIDNFVANAEALVADACARALTVSGRYFPGIRAEAPPAYQQLLLTRLRSALLECLGMPDGMPDMQRMVERPHHAHEFEHLSGIEPASD